MGEKEICSENFDMLDVSNMHSLFGKVVDDWASQNPILFLMTVNYQQVGGVKFIS
ncbi:MAG: hypothetical protein KJ826_12165 [Proteobacteria bacterium]|nr:hypothetical protein [Pseudomonadota bacterium]